MSGFATGPPYFGKMPPREADDLRLGLSFVRSLGTGGNEGNPPVQLDLLPLHHSPPRVSSPGHATAAALPWQPLAKASSWTESVNGETRSSGGGHGVSLRGIDVNQVPSATDYDDDAVASSPNSTVSSFQIDSAMNPGSHSSSGKRERDNNDPERASSRASDEEEADATRKKLRLSKEQSALLEESFKEHSTLNPKQKLALAKQLGLRPRQVEVWFQNRRARTKLKQTEVDCEFLKRCCENLTEENRRLQKEVQDLRALKVPPPFYMQMPAATLTMCPSCERVASADNHRALPPWLTLTSNASQGFHPPVRS